MFKNLKKLGIFTLVLAQVAAVGIVMPTSAGAFASPVTRSMENLDRGVVATKTDDGVLVSWRRLGTEPADTVFTLYRNKEKIAEDAITNFVDASGTAADKYTVVANGEMSKPASVWENGYLDIPLAAAPESDVVQMDRNGVYVGAYTPGDSSYGDLDGDGEYEIVMLWNPSDAKDAASGGRTGKVFMDAYKMDGTFMWRIDMGWNIRAGQHDTMLNVADFDGDGRAEVMVRTADGTIDGTGKMLGDESKGTDYESSWAALNGGKNLQGPLYVTVFDGETGAALDSIDYFVNNVAGSQSVSLSFGDDFGNRSERYNSTIAYIHPNYPSAVFSRGYYWGKGISTPNGRTSCAAYSYRNGKLTMDWGFDSNDPKWLGYHAQGNHQIEAGDVDGDGKDEIFYGSLAWDDDGTILWCSYQEHGDAMHLGDFDPTLPGLEWMKVYEDYNDDSDAFAIDGPKLSPYITANTVLKNSKAAEASGARDVTQRHQWGSSLQNAKTGEFYQIHNGIKDTGRGMIANIGYKDSFYVLWGAGSSGYWNDKGEEIPDLHASMNGRIYWDGDLQDELQDHNGAGKEINVTKWNDEAGQFDKIFEGKDSHSINSTKGNPNLQADLLGDWREELVSYVILGEDTQTEKMTIKGDYDMDVEVEMKKTTYKYALRIFETPYPTKYNFYTLAHDDVYRNSSATDTNCYNQPPHISWYMNDAIADSPYTTQPDANITLVSNNYKPTAFNEALLPEAGAAPAGATPFVDIASHWGKPFIEKMYKAGVIAGMDDTHFAPDSQVTVGQFVTLISQALKLETADADGHWATKFVNAANAASLIDEHIAVATSDDLEKPISREEMASLVARAAAYKGIAVAEDAKTIEFTDAASIDSWFTGDVNNAVALGIINGIDDEATGTTKFDPLANATRAHAATMLSQLYDLF